MKIAIHGKTFLSWGGGVDLLTYFIKAFSLYQNELYILLPERNFLKKFEFFIRKIRKKQKESNGIPLNDTINFFRTINENIKFIKYENDNFSGLSKKISKEKINVICPSADTLGKNFIVPWVGYIFDLQHKYLPEFFSEKEKNDRDKNILKILNEANSVLVNSKFVKEGLKKFYNADLNKIFVLPFAPFLRNTSLLYENINLTDKQLPSKFFLISNQFWYHKSHITAFYALKKLEEKHNIKDIHIVCTGNTFDYRQPDYFDYLKKEIYKLKIDNRVHFLGFIPKHEQIAVMKKSIAVIQPTLFEGGPGGGAVYDALCLGVPAIVSDIEVNKEICEDEVIFFKTKDYEDLAEKMHLLLISENKKIENETLLKINAKREEKFSKYLMDLIHMIIKNNF